MPKKENVMATIMQYKGAILLCLVTLLLLGAGTVSYVIQEIQGPGISGMSNGFNWGLYIAVFETFMGIASGCLVVASVAWLFNVKALKPFAPYAAVAAFGFLAASGIMIMQDLGRLQNMLYMVTSLNFSSPLAGDVMIMTAFAIVSLALAYVLMVPAWKRDGYWMAAWARKRDEAKYQPVLDKIARIASAFGLVIGLAAPFITSLIFEELTTRLWWGTSLLSLDFLVLGMASGFAFVLLLAAIRFDAKQFAACKTGVSILSWGIILGLLAHLAIFAVQVQGNASGDSLQAGQLMTVLQDNATLAVFEIVLVVLAVLVLVVPALRRLRPAAGFAALLAVTAGFLPRMLMMYLGFNVTPMSLNVAGSYWAVPISSGVEFAESTFMGQIGYAPTLLEWGVVLVPVGIVCLVLAVCIAFVRAPE